MANGIGAAILDGCSFRDLLVRMGGRFIEEPTKGPNSADEWDLKQLRELKKLSRMPVKRALLLYGRKAEESHQRLVQAGRAIEASRRKTLKTYLAMRAQVRAWKAPKPLAGLKRAILRQIDENIGHDCEKTFTVPRKMTAAEYLNFEMEQLTGAAERAIRDMRKRRRERTQENVAIHAMRRELRKLDPPKQTAVA